MLKRLTITCIFYFLAISLPAQNISNLTLPDVNTGDDFSLDLLDNPKAVVLIFMSNKCPFATTYLERLDSLDREFGEVTFLMINSFDAADESMIDMKTTWIGWDTSIPYLADKSQNLLEEFNVRKSPTAVLLKPLNNGYSIYYRGKIDNNPQIAADVKEAYLRDNLISLLENRPPAHANNQPVGCTIIKR